MSNNFPSEAVTLTSQVSNLFLYTDPLVLSDSSHHTNVFLISNDGFHYRLRKCVFAVSLPLNSGLRQLLPDDDEDVMISTELSKDQLGQVVNFFTSGYLAVSDVTEELGDAFKIFGINLFSVKLEKVTSFAYK